MRRVSYVLRYGYERPGRVWWEFVEGDGVERIEGEFTFEPLDGGERTLATYRLGIDAGVPMPGADRAEADARRDGPRRAGAQGRGRAASGVRSLGPRS